MLGCEPMTWPKALRSRSRSRRREFSWRRRERSTARSTTTASTEKSSGLVKVVVGALLHGLDRAGDRSEGGHHHEGGLAVRRLRLLHQADAVEAGHLQVGEHHVGRGTLRACTSALKPSAAVSGAVPLLAEDLGGGRRARWPRRRRSGSARGTPGGERLSRGSAAAAAAKKSGRKSAHERARRAPRREGAPGPEPGTEPGAESGPKSGTKPGTKCRGSGAGAGSVAAPDAGRPGSGRAPGAQREFPALSVE